MISETQDQTARSKFASMRSALPSQVELFCLSIPYLQSVGSMNDDEEHEVFSRSGSAHSSKGQATAEQMTFEYTAAILAADADSYAHHAEHPHSDEAADCPSQIAWTNHFEPERKMQKRAAAQPPKRFFRTFWRSISWRLLRHAPRYSA